MESNKIPFFNRIVVKITFTLLGVTLLAIVFIGVAIPMLALKNLEDDITNRNVVLAHQAANQIDSYLHGIIDNLGSLGESLFALSKNRWELDAVLENYSSQLKSTGAIIVIDEEGNIVADSQIIDTFEVTEEILEASWDEEITFTSVRFSENKLPYLDVIFNLQRYDGSRYRLIAELSLRDIWDLVDSIKIGEHGFVQLLTKDKKEIIAHKDKKKILRQSSSPDIIDLPNITIPEEGLVEQAKDEFDELILSTYVSIPIKQLDWVVIVSQPYAEIIYPLSTIIYQSVYIIVLVVLSILGIGYSFTKPVHNGLVKILYSIDRLREGDLNTYIHIRENNELGVLADSFNMMIRDLKKTSEALVSSEEKYRLITENVSDIIFVLDNDFHLTFANNRLEELIGYSFDEVESQPFFKGILKQIEERFSQQELFFLKNPNSVGSELEVEFVNKNGELKIFSINIVVARIEGRYKNYFAVARDVTRQKEDEKALRHYQQRLIDMSTNLSMVEERERRKVADDLHDDIGQTLAISKMRLGILKKKVQDGGNAKIIEDIYSLIESSIKSVRDLTYNLGSPVLYTLGLKPAIIDLVEKTEENHHIHIDFHAYTDVEPSDKDISILLYRGVKELVNNIIKHAEAGSITIMYNFIEGNIRITVEDDGKGFEVEKEDFIPDSSGGFGLFSLKERLQYLGGEVRMYSRINEGTKAILVAPLRKLKTFKGGKE